MTAPSRFRPSPNSIHGTASFDSDVYITGNLFIGGSVSVSGTGEANTGNNLGPGEGVFQGKSGVVLNFRSLLGTGSVSVVSGSQTITISGSQHPEQHAISHEDGGDDEILVSGLLGELNDPQKVTVRYNNGPNVGSRPRLNFLSGNNIAISASEDILNDEIDITISSTSSGSISSISGSNIGSGEGVFANVSGSTLQFRSLVGSGSVTILSGSNSIIIKGNDNNGTVYEEYVQDLTSSASQTIFSLDLSPVDPNDVIMYVNGTAYNLSSSYTVSGTIVTWLNSPFILDQGDGIKFTYSITSSNSSIINAANIGAGEGWFANKNGNILNFRTILGTGSVSVVSGSNTITISGSSNVNVVNGTTFYSSSAFNPTGTTPNAGDRYYNTINNMEMLYDSSRGKWLSGEAVKYSFGRRGTTASGSFYKDDTGITFTISRGYEMPFSGTIISFIFQRNNVLSAIFEILSNGIVINTLSSSATTGSAETNVDFLKGDIISFRNQQNDGNDTVDVNGSIRIKWRV